MDLPFPFADFRLTPHYPAKSPLDDVSFASLPPARMSTSRRSTLLKSCGFSTNGAKVLRHAARSAVLAKFLDASVEAIPLVPTQENCLRMTSMPFPNGQCFPGLEPAEWLRRSVQEFRQYGKSGRRCLKLGSFVEKPHDFKSVLLRDVLIRAGGNEAKNIIKRRLRGIVGVRRKSAKGKVEVPSPVVSEYRRKGRRHEEEPGEKQRRPPHPSQEGST